MKQSNAIEACDLKSRETGIAHVVIHEPGTHTEVREGTGFHVVTRAEANEQMSEVVHVSKIKQKDLAKHRLATAIHEAKQDVKMYEQIFDTISATDKQWITVSKLLTEAREYLSLHQYFLSILEQR